MIKVFYGGWIRVDKLVDFGVGSDAKHMERASREFYLTKSDSKRFENIGNVTVTQLKPINSDDYDDGDALFISDLKGSTDPFTLTTDKIQDIHENGNALKLIFDDDAPIDDVTPIEKELSESKENGYLLTIGAMLKWFDATQGGLKHDYLTEWICDKYKKDIHGLSESSITKRFARANDILNEKLKDK